MLLRRPPSIPTYDSRVSAFFAASSKPDATMLDAGSNLTGCLLERSSNHKRLERTRRSELMQVSSPMQVYRDEVIERVTSISHDLSQVLLVMREEQTKGIQLYHSICFITYELIMLNMFHNLAINSSMVNILLDTHILQARLPSSPHHLIFYLLYLTSQIFLN